MSSWPSVFLPAPRERPQKRSPHVFPRVFAFGKAEAQRWAMNPFACTSQPASSSASVVQRAVRTEPAYEWLGCTVMYAPDFGRFEADCDPSGPSSATHTGLPWLRSWSWLDAIAGLAVAGVAVKEGITAWQGGAC